MFNSMGILLRLQYGERFFVSENQHGSSCGNEDNKVAVASCLSEITCLIVPAVVFGSFRVKTKNKRAW